MPKLTLRYDGSEADFKGWLSDALSCLKEYRQYGEEMRSIGRGFHPTGKQGHCIDDVISGFEAALGVLR